MNDARFYTHWVYLCVFFACNELTAVGSVDDSGGTCSCHNARSFGQEQLSNGCSACGSVHGYKRVNGALMLQAQRNTTLRAVDKYKAGFAMHQLVLSQGTALDYVISFARRAYDDHSNLLMLEKILIPTIFFGIGLMLYAMGYGYAGKIICFLGAQTAMNLYMKLVFASSVVSEGRTGMPAGFVVTILQQFTGFGIMLVWIIVSRFTPYPYTPKQLTSRKEYFLVGLFSLTFAGGVALKNYSLALIPLSVNLVLCSCAPLGAWLMQLFVSWCAGLNNKKDQHPSQVVLMVLGTLFSIFAVVCKSLESTVGSTSTEGSAGAHYWYGVWMCVLGLVCAMLNLALVGVVGTSVSLNEFDTVLYMAIPASCFLVGPMMFLKHPVNWEPAGYVTDWEVLLTVMELSPSTLVLAALSGVFSLAFNLLKYNIVQSLSATHMAFAGNFNKAATILIAFCVGLEMWPHDIWGVAVVAAYLGNMVSFTSYSLLSVGSAKESKPSK